MRPDQLAAAVNRATRPSPRQIFAPVGILVLGLGTVAFGQIPPPHLEAARSTDFVARREAIYRDEQARRAVAVIGGSDRSAAAPDPTRLDGSTRFDPLDEVVPATISGNVPAAESALRSEVAGKLFDLAIAASKTKPAPLAFIDDCLRGVLRRQPDHAEARRLLGFVPHGKGGWATPFAAQELARGKVKDPTFGWVPADWVPHLQRGELPAPRATGRWLPADQADALRREWKDGWTITTEHFEIHANVPLSGVIAFGRQLETFHQLFLAIMADVIGPEQLPLARRLDKPQLQPTVASRQHKVDFFATRAEYAQHLAPVMTQADQSLGIYLPRKEFKSFGAISYFFNDAGGQLDVADTLYHEVSHQLLFESAGTDNHARNVGNYWVFEGLGTYFETVRTAADGSLRVGGLVGPRIARAKQRLIDGHELIPLEPFVRMGRVAFNAEGGGDIFLNYLEAMSLTVFLMQADDTHYREPFLDYVRDAYKGQLRNGVGRTLDDRLTRPYADLQREFAAYLGRVIVGPVQPGGEAQKEPVARP